MQNQRICANCGTPAQAGEQFCGECGAALPAINSQPPVTSQPFTPPPTISQPPYQGQPPYQTGGPIAPPPMYNTQPPVYVTPPAPAKRSSPLPLIIGAVVVLLIVGVVVTVLFLTNNNKSNNTTNPQSSNSGGATVVNPTAAPDNGSGNSSGGTSSSNAALLKQGAANMRSAKSYHIDVRGSSSGTALTMAGDVDVANTKSNLTISSAGQTVQVISIGSNNYVSTDNGTTFTNAGSAGASITSGLNQFTSMWNSITASDIDQAGAALKDGSPATDTIDGSSCKHMTASLSDVSSLGSGLGSTSGSLDLWAATDGSRVCQMKVVTTDQTTNLTLKWSNLNGTFNIQTPPGS